MLLSLSDSTSRLKCRKRKSFKYSLKLLKPADFIANDNWFSFTCNAFDSDYKSYPY